MKRHRLWQQCFKLGKKLALAALLLALLAAVLIATHFKDTRFKSVSSTNHPPDFIGTASAEAWQHYQKGQFFLAQSNDELSPKALGEFQLSIQADTNFALAYVGLAWAYSDSAYYGNPPMRAKEAYAKEAEAARHALALDASLADAYAALGDAKLMYGWDVAEAERLFRRAVELEPKDGGHLTALAFCLSCAGKFEEAISLARQALALAPELVDVNKNLGGVLTDARRYDEAIVHLRKASELFPRDKRVHSRLGQALLLAGQDVEAKAVFLRVRYLETSDAGELRHSEDYLARYGARGYWLDQLERMRQRPDRYPRASVWAAVAVQAGEHEEAMLWVEKWFDDPWAFASLKVDPTFDSLRSEPRFRALMKKAGLDK